MAWRYENSSEKGKPVKYLLALCLLGLLAFGIWGVTAFIDPHKDGISGVFMVTIGGGGFVLGTIVELGNKKL